MGRIRNTAFLRLHLKDLPVYVCRQDGRVAQQATMNLLNHIHSFHHKQTNEAKQERESRLRRARSTPKLEDEEVGTNSTVGQIHLLANFLLLNTNYRLHCKIGDQYTSSQPSTWQPNNDNDLAVTDIGGESKEQFFFMAVRGNKKKGKPCFAFSLNIYSVLLVS